MLPDLTLTQTEPGHHKTGSIGQARPVTVDALVREIHQHIDGDDWLRLSRAKVRKVAKAAMRHPDPYAAANALLHRLAKNPAASSISAAVNAEFGRVISYADPTGEDATWRALQAAEVHDD